jgi:hypothetical protein
MQKTAYRIDIDGTIAEPLFYDGDFQHCLNYYLRAKLITVEDMAHLKHHQQVYLLPQVLLTHKVIPGALEKLQELTEKGVSLRYFTVRQALDPEQCLLVYRNTHLWLERCHFPNPMDAQFFWDPAEKLVKSLKAQEDQVVVIDDRPEGLIASFQKILTQNPLQASQIRERVTLVAFGRRSLQGLPPTDLYIHPLENWSQFQFKE